MSGARFSVFACPGGDGYTPEFWVCDRNVLVGQAFRTHAEAIEDRDARDFAASGFKRAEWDSEESRS